MLRKSPPANVAKRLRIRTQDLSGPAHRLSQCFRFTRRGRAGARNKEIEQHN